MLSDARRWLVKAEVYRAVAKTMCHQSTRASFERMALTCERMSKFTRRRGVVSAEECLALAEECNQFADQFVTPSAQAAIAEVAQRWRDLSFKARKHERAKLRLKMPMP